jgi:hypothetical protein
MLNESDRDHISESSSRVTRAYLGERQLTKVHPIILKLLSNTAHYLDEWPCSEYDKEAYSDRSINHYKSLIPLLEDGVDFVSAYYRSGDSNGDIHRYERELVCTLSYIRFLEEELKRSDSGLKINKGIIDESDYVPTNSGFLNQLDTFIGHSNSDIDQLKPGTTYDAIFSRILRDVNTFTKKNGISRLTPFHAFDSLVKDPEKYTKKIKEVEYDEKKCPWNEDVTWDNDIPTAITIDRKKYKIEACAEDIQPSEWNKKRFQLSRDPRSMFVHTNPIVGDIVEHTTHHLRDTIFEEILKADQVDKLLVGDVLAVNDIPHSPDLLTTEFDRYALSTVFVFHAAQKLGEEKMLQLLEEIDSSNNRPDVKSRSLSSWEEKILEESRVIATEDMQKYTKEVEDKAIPTRLFTISVPALDMTVFYTQMGDLKSSSEQQWKRALKLVDDIVRIKQKINPDTPYPEQVHIFQPLLLDSRFNIPQGSFRSDRLESTLNCGGFRRDDFILNIPTVSQKKGNLVIDEEWLQRVNRHEIAHLVAKRYKSTCLEEGRAYYIEGRDVGTKAIGSTVLNSLIAKLSFLFEVDDIVAILDKHTEGEGRKFIEEMVEQIK